MIDRGCLIIDDIGSALSSMTLLGRAVTETGCEAIRTAVLAFALRRSWTVVSHQAYVEWAHQVLQKDGLEWCVLDPLFVPRDLGERARMVRLTRQFGAETKASHEFGFKAGGWRFSGKLGVLDDAASSGRTLRHVTELLTRSDGSVEHIVLCASSRTARDSVRSFVQGARWTDFVLGDWRVIHLRDGCPHLPFSGRPTNQPAVADADGSVVELRTPSSAVAGNLWQVLLLDPAISRAISSARGDIVRRLSDALKRPACVRDLHLLGPCVPALISPGTVATGDTALESLLTDAPSL